MFISAKYLLNPSSDEIVNLRLFTNLDGSFYMVASSPLRIYGSYLNREYFLKEWEIVDFQFHQSDVAEDYKHFIDIIRNNKIDKILE